MALPRLTSISTLTGGRAEGSSFTSRSRPLMMMYRHVTFSRYLRGTQCCCEPLSRACPQHCSPFKQGCHSNDEAGMLSVNCQLPDFIALLMSQAFPASQWDYHT